MGREAEDELRHAVDCVGRGVDVRHAAQEAEDRVQADGDQKQRPKEEKEKYNTGNGDPNSPSYPREPYSLKKPAPHAVFADATAAFLRCHDKTTVPSPKVSAQQRKRINMGLEKERPSTLVW